MINTTRQRAGAALLSLLALTAAGADQTPAVQPQPGGVYRAPLAAEPITLDPARYTDIYSMTVAANLYDGLVQFNDQLKVVPAIASLWKISRDRRTYTFMLREDVKFHHGREVTAQDFVFSFRRILHPDTESPVASLFLKIKGAEAFRQGEADTVVGLRALQPHLLQIELEEPFAPFLSILAMVNAKVVAQDAVELPHPVGTGPFRFSDWRPGEALRLDANRDYYGPPAHLDALHFKIYTAGGWEQIFADFQRGELEHASIPSDRYDHILNNPAGYKIVSKPGLNLVYIGLNAAIAPLDDVRVRQAINHAVNTDQIVNAITKRGSVPARGILPPGIAGFNPDFPGYRYDPERARALLAEAGYPDGEGLPTLRLWTAAKHQSVHRELQAYQDHLAQVGISTEIHVADSWKAFIEAINNRQAEMFYAAWYADYPDPDNFFFPLAHSQSPTNRMRFNNPQVDLLIEQARGELDSIRRAHLYRKAEQLFMQHAPIVSQHTNSSNYLFQPWVRDANTSRLGTIYLPFREIWFDLSLRTERKAPKLARSGDSVGGPSLRR